MAIARANNQLKLRGNVQAADSLRRRVDGELTPKNVGQQCRKVISQLLDLKKEGRAPQCLFNGVIFTRSKGEITGVETAFERREIGTLINQISVNLKYKDLTIRDVYAMQAAGDKAGKLLENPPGEPVGGKMPEEVAREVMELGRNAVMWIADKVESYRPK